MRIYRKIISSEEAAAAVSPAASASEPCGFGLRLWAAAVRAAVRAGRRSSTAVSGKAAARRAARPPSAEARTKKSRESCSLKDVEAYPSPAFSRASIILAVLF